MEAGGTAKWPIVDSPLVFFFKRAPHTVMVGDLSAEHMAHRAVVTVDYQLNLRVSLQHVLWSHCSCCDLVRVTLASWWPWEFYILYVCMYYVLKYSIDTTHFFFSCAPVGKALLQKLKEAFAGGVVKAVACHVSVKKRFCFLGESGGNGEKEETALPW